MTDRQTALAHYLGMEREAREDRAKELNATILDIALAANGLCESPDYDAQELLNADKAYAQWSDQIDSQEKDNADPSS